jgi:cellulose synthase/poly-beta-1,6-N-acetylglucosamine synthase-like glycosyltransferase
MLAAIALSLAAAFVLYVIVGYPLLLASARQEGPEIQKDPGFRATVSAIVAVHNGEKFIAEKLDSLLALQYPTNLLDILVVSDGSTDGTDRIVESFADRGVRLLRVPRGGKAAALNAAIQGCSGEILFFTDVRQKLDPAALSHLVANFADPAVGAATGELRFIQRERSGEQADLTLYWRYELWARGRHSRIDSIFGATGCIYAIRRRLVEPLPHDTLSDDVMMAIRVFLRGYRVIFDPKAVAFDYPTADGAEFQRKLRTLAGLWQVFARLPELFTTANRMRLHFLSHKFARLLLPWAILAAIGATVALPDTPVRVALMAGEAGMLLLAVVDIAMPKWLPLKRITSPARTFLMLNAAAALSTIVFIVPPATLWRPTRVKAPR